LSLIAFLFLSLSDPFIGGLAILLELFVFVSYALGAFTNDYYWLIKEIIGKSNEINVPGMGESLVIPIVAPIAVFYLRMEQMFYINLF
jgi:hypothetical protein